MKPPKRKHLIVAVLANNQGAETTDFLVLYAVLSESGLADVLAVAPAAEAIQLRPSIKIKPQATLNEFDQRFPDGADYVVVPAMPTTPTIIAWLQAQAAKGATIMGVCAGTLALSEAGLLKVKRQPAIGSASINSEVKLRQCDGSPTTGLLRIRG